MTAATDRPVLDCLPASSTGVAAPRSSGLLRGQLPGGLAFLLIAPLLALLAFALFAPILRILAASVLEPRPGLSNYATGVRVVPISTSYGEMMAKTAAMQASGTVEWDIIAPQFTELAQISGYLADLEDCSGMPSIARDAMAGSCGRWGVLYVIGGQMLCWNPALYKDRQPKGWADFWDVERFPGRRAMASTGSPWATLMLTLLADGVASDTLFPLDLDRAFRKLNQIKPHVAVWWRTGDQSKTMWRNSDIAMSMMWSGTAYEAKHGGIPLDWTFNQAIADFGAWCILKGAPHPNAARAFINFYMSNPESHACFAREIGYATPNQASSGLLTADEKKELVTTAEEMSSIIKVDADWLAANRAQALERWTAWVSA